MRGKGNRGARGSVKGKINEWKKQVSPFDPSLTMFNKHWAFQLKFSLGHITHTTKGDLGMPKQVGSSVFIHLVTSDPPLVFPVHLNHALQISIISLELG